MFYYRDSNILPPVKYLLDSPNVNDSLLSPLSRSTLRVCFLYFCRISELLRASIGDVVHPDRVVLHGAKGSNSYMIYLPTLSRQMLLSSVNDTTLPLFPISYIKLYRDAVKIGIQFRVSESVNSRRLHCARYLFSKQSKKSINGSELAGVLRHRSNRNYLSYLK